MTAGTEIERALAEYFEEIIDPKKLLAEREREKQIVDLASKLKTALYWRRRQVPWPKHDPEQPLRDLQAVTSVLWRHQQIFDDLDISCMSERGAATRRVRVWCCASWTSGSITLPANLR